MEPLILYEDESIIVVHKPFGMPVETKQLGKMDLVSYLKNIRAKNKEETYVGVIHRLDQPVEGVMVFAKNKQAAAKLSLAVQQHKVDKEYQAVVFWNRSDKEQLTEQGTLVDYLLQDKKSNCSQVVTENTKGAKRAQLSYQVLQKNKSFALLSIQLLTGRHHQIRVQLSNCGMPIVGDQKYKSVENEGIKLDRKTGKNIALCSVALTFLHPVTKEKLTFKIQPTNPCFLLLTKSLDQE